MTVLRPKKERALLAQKAKRWLEKAKQRKVEERASRVRKKKVVRKDPPLLCTTPPQPKAPHL